MAPRTRLIIAALLPLAGHAVHGLSARAASSSEAVRSNRWAEEVVTAVGARRSGTSANEIPGRASPAGFSPAPDREDGQRDGKAAAGSNGGDQNKGGDNKGGRGEARGRD
jgi:hypothetical protein